MELVTLRNGPTSPLAALRLLWSLEDRGLTFRVSDGRLVVAGAGIGALSSADRTTITKLKAHLIEIVAYQPPVVVIECAQRKSPEAEIHQPQGSTATLGEDSVDVGTEVPRPFSHTS